MADSLNSSNYTLMQALNQYNDDQVMTQTMWYIEVAGEHADAFGKAGLDAIQIYGKNFTIPNRTNEFQDVNYRGYPIPTPTVLKMENSHTMTIIADVDGKLRKGFLGWQAQAIDPTITKQIASFGSDRRPTVGAGGNILRMNLLAPNYIDVETCITIYGVRVESVGGISLSNDDGGIATFDVGFKSVYWEESKCENDEDAEGENAEIYKTKYGAKYLPHGDTDIGTIDSTMRTSFAKVAQR